MFCVRYVLFVYSKNNQVFALGRPKGGDLRYLARPQVTGATLRPPIVIGEFVLYPSGANLEIFNSAGRPVRTIELEKTTRGPGVVSGSTLYIGLDHTAGTGVLASVDLNRPYHYVNWEMMTGSAVSPAPVMDGKNIYAAAEDGKIYAVNEERNPVWKLPGGSYTFNTQGKFVSDLKIDDFGLYAANTDSKLFCIDKANGRLKWQYYSGSPLNTSPVVFPTMVYQYVPGTGIAAIDKANGTFNRQPKWTVKNARRVLAEDANNTYLADQNGHILAVDKKTGQTLFTSKSKWDVFATNLTDSTIYAISNDGKLTAVKPILRDGEVSTVVMDFRAEPCLCALIRID